MYWAARPNRFINNVSFKDYIGAWCDFKSSSTSDNSQDIESILTNEFKVDLEPEDIESLSVTLPAKDFLGNTANITINTKATRVPTYKVIVNNTNRYDPVELGKALVFNKSLGIFEKIKDFLVLDGQNRYAVAGSSYTDDNNQPVTTDPNDVVVTIGYDYWEKHEYDGQDDSQWVFYETEAEIIKVGNYVSDFSSNYLTFAVCVYDTYVIDAYKLDNKGYVILDELNQPTKLDGVMNRKYLYSITKEGYDKTVTESYISNIDLDSVEPYYKILTESAAKNNPNFSTIVVDIQNDYDLFPPVVPLRIDGKWVRDINPELYDMGKRALWHAKGSWKHYDEVVDSLQGSDGINDTKYIAYSFGVSANSGQLDCNARYIVEFFKHTHWCKDYKLGENVRVDRWYRWYLAIETNAWINIRIHYKYVNTSFVAGTGKNPINPEARLGQCGFGYFEGRCAWYRQIDADHWELGAAESTEVFFRDIKDSKNWSIYNYASTIAKPFYKTKNGKIKDYADTMFPILKSIINSIPINNVCDLAQYSPVLLMSTYKVVKLKWWQTGIFQVIMLIILIIIQIVSCGSTTALTVAFIIQAIGSALLYALVVTVAVMVAAKLVNTILKPILKKVIGDVLTNIICSVVTIVVTIVAIYYGGALVGLTSGSSGLLGYVAANSAQIICQTSLAALNGVGNYYKEKAIKLINENKALQEEYQKKNEHLQELNAELLPDNISWDLYYSLKYSSAPYVESAPAFIQRTLINIDTVVDAMMYPITNIADYNNQLNVSV